MGSWGRACSVRWGEAEKEQRTETWHKRGRRAANTRPRRSIHQSPGRHRSIEKKRKRDTLTRSVEARRLMLLACWCGYVKPASGPLSILPPPFPSCPTLCGVPRPPLPLLCVSPGPHSIPLSTPPLLLSPRRHALTIFSCLNRPRLKRPRPKRPSLKGQSSKSQPSKGPVAQSAHTLLLPFFLSRRCRWTCSGRGRRGRSSCSSSSR